MTNATARSATALALLFSLGACTSFLGMDFARKAPRPSTNQPTDSRDAAPTQMAVEIGREQLKQGNVGAAIQSFQRSLGNGEPEAPALNGLGVAYARLGRHDVAHRMFQAAIAADPLNGRYAANLARAMQARLAAQLPSQNPAAISYRQAATTSHVRGALQRVSRAEVRIQTANLQPAPLRSHASALDQRFKPLIRIAIANTGRATAKQAPDSVTASNLPAAE